MNWIRCVSNALVSLQNFVELKKKILFHEFVPLEIGTFKNIYLLDPVYTLYATIIIIIIINIITVILLLLLLLLNLKSEKVGLWTKFDRHFHVLVMP